MILGDFMSKQIYLFATSKHPDAISAQSLQVRFLKPQIDFSKYDYLIITSKQTIKALKQYNTQEFINLPALCVSKKTADSYKDFGGEILDFGDGYGDNLVSHIEKKPKDTKWLYLRAQSIASDFVARCKAEAYSIDEKILYVSECAKEALDIEVKKGSILIFTSPSSVECFLKTHTIDLDAKIIVIGTTTAKALPRGVNYKISQNTSIESCMKLALSLQ